MKPEIEIDGTRHRLVVLEAGASLDGDGWVRALLAADPGTLRGGEPVALFEGTQAVERAEGGNLLEGWEVVARQRAGLTLGRPSGPEPRQTRIGVHQRSEGEAVEAFLNRWLAPRSVASNGEDGEMADLDCVVPVGSCLVQTPGSGILDRWIRGRAVVAAQSPSFVGWSRLLGRERRGRFHAPDEANANWRVVLKSERWELRGGAAEGVATKLPESGGLAETGGEPFLELQGTFSLDEAAVERLLPGMAEGQRFEVATGEEIPLLPITVRWMERWMFCRRLALRLRFDAPLDEPNLSVCLTLDPSRPVARPSGGTPMVHRWIGRFERWLADGQGVEVGPATDDQRRALGFGGGGAWQVVGGEGGAALLRARVLSPGFVREHYSAHYARFEPGDVLLLEVADGEVPLVLGALQIRREAFESASGPAQVLSGSTVVLRTVGADGQPAGCELTLGADGKAIVSAKDRLALLENVVVRGDRTEFAKDVSVRKRLEVD